MKTFGKKTLILHEKDYGLVKWEYDKKPTEFVVAYRPKIVRGEVIEWVQGTYFNDFKNAHKSFLKKVNTGW